MNQAGRGRATFLLLAALVILFVATSGCSPGRSVGELRVQSLSDAGGQLAANYRVVVYAPDRAGDVSFMLTDIAVEELINGTARNGQIMHVTLLWRPKAGSTPIDDSATNICIRHVVIAEGEVGLYGGAGYANAGGLDRPRARISVEDATVRLLESTEGFVDPLSPARVTGSFVAVRDPDLAERLHRAASQLVTNAFGHTRFVDGGGPGAAELLATR